ncbi:hypothetical protein, partial [Novosphingobium sp. AAP93]|uniref:hypothetical protein n=1 Tax=Novosphingobium sp. AAP93 TaxID=1523427 RepID=UPI000A593C45
GDNIMAALPDVIANTIGNLVADQVAGDGRPKFDSRRADSDLNSTMASLAAEAKANSAQIYAQGRADNQAMMLELAGQGATGFSQGGASVLGVSSVGNATMAIFAQRLGLSGNPYSIGDAKCPPVSDGNFGPDGYEFAPNEGSVRYSSLHSKGNSLSGTIYVDVVNISTNNKPVLIKPYIDKLNTINGSYKDGDSTYNININFEFAHKNWTNWLNSNKTNTVSFRYVDNVSLYAEQEGVTGISYKESAYYTSGGFLYDNGQPVNPHIVVDQITVDSGVPHEFLHSAGLGHNKFSGTLMYPCLPDTGYLKLTPHEAGWLVRQYRGN